MTWCTIRAKYVLAVVDERAGGRDLPLLAVSIHRGVVKRSELTDDEPRADDLSNYKVVRANEIALNRMRAFQGGIGIAPTEGLISPDYLVLRATGATPRFLHHLCRSSWFVGEMSSRLRGIGSSDQGNVRTPRINAEDLGDIRIRVPNFGRQEAIADFLDVETARIDALIDGKQRLASLLGERWRAMASSRFADLRTVYGTISLKRVVVCLDGSRIPLSAEERAQRPGPFPYYGASTVVDYIDDFLFNEELVLLGEDGAQLADVTFPISLVARGKYWVNNHAHVLRPVGYDAELLSYQLNTFDRLPFISGATRPKITQDDMATIPVANVPLAKQRRVRDEFDRSWRTVIALRERLDRQIRLLHEHRQALVTAAVTGELEIAV
jgi:type I restriction enzyme S subunit